MFLKLTKHELAESGRILLPLSGLLLLLSLLAGISGRYMAGAFDFNSVFLSICSVLLMVAFFLGMFAVFVMLYVVMIERFRRTLLTDRGYLTNTLPVSVHGLILSRLLSACLYALLATVTGVLALLIFVSLAAGLDFSVVDFVREVYDELRAADLSLSAFYIPALLTGVVSFVFSCLHFYAAMVIGHSFANHKGLLSVVFYFVISSVIRVVTSALAVSRFSVMGFLDSLDSFIHLYNQVLYSALALELVLSAVLYCGTWHMLKHRLNLA